jgi:hypothetical protein
LQRAAASTRADVDFHRSAPAAPPGRRLGERFVVPTPRRSDAG